MSTDREAARSAAHEAPRDNTRLRDEALETTPGSRDTTPALGAPGQPGSYRRAVEGAAVALFKRAWEDARWSYLFKGDTAYAPPAATDGRVPAAARRMRGGPEPPAVVQGPIIHPAVWTWEVPLYFWLGGIATGSSFVSVACDVVGDHDSAGTARKVALAAAVPCSPLLIKDLGRPARFLNMLRIFKPRSPMSMGAWCLVAYTNAAVVAVAADVLGLERPARRLGTASAVLATYLGSYTGVLLASTVVPVWARSRLFLAPIFICTAAATGAAATRLTLVAGGLRPAHPTRRAIGWVETSAMVSELVLSHYAEKRLGRLGDALEHGRPGKLFKGAKAAVQAGLALRLAGGRGGGVAQHASSVLFLAAGLAFRYAWVGAGRTSALDHEAVARMARVPATDLGKEQL